MSYLQITRFPLMDISSIDIITEEMKLDNIVYFPKFIESEIYYHPLIFWKKKIITTTYNNAIVNKEYIAEHPGGVVDENFFINRDVEFLKIKKWMTGGKFSIDGAIKKSSNKVIGKDYYSIYLIPQICIHYNNTSDDLFFFNDKSELLEFLNDLKREAEENTTLYFSVGTINGNKDISGVGNLKNLIDKIITIND